jgi:glycosyltransferase involved in cell wall biosynthesis
MMPARVSAAKDHQSLISAFEIVNDGNMKLVLCGAGTDTSQFIGFAKALAPSSHKYISFLGERADIQDVYSRSHIVALISNFEALPLSIIEAMSCSRAIIATNVGGVPELIASGANGILVRPNCVDDIVEALTIYRDEKIRAEFGKKAKLTYEERFTDKSMLISIARTYKTLCGF